jgi:hypothetical protein
MNMNVVTLDQECYLNVYQEHIPCPSGSSSVIVVILERLNV